MRKRILLALAVLTAAAIATTTAASAGGPSAGLSQGWNGVTRGNERYVSVPAGAWTSIQAIDRRGGRVLRYMSLKGTWGIPLVAFDGTAEGLLPDGRTLILAQPVFSGNSLRSVTSFALVDIRKMKLRRTIRIPGAMSFDAVSPDGRYVYLIEYISHEDPSLYRVRVYDLDSSRLLAKIVADRKSWETGMQGSPVTRAWKDGWAYTLYGGNARPFVHALNTRAVEAVCIDMPWKYSPQRLFDYRLRTDGDGHLVVRGPHGRALVVIDRKSFRVLSAVRTP
jgi:DNA-binding beta-propeller fold protein YncE